MTAVSRLFQFLSTPSARRATHEPQRLHQRGRISIHALREEGDPARPHVQPPVQNFYPRPPRGGRRLLLGVLLGIPLNFYPRPPRGGRHALICFSFFRTGFLSTPSARRATSVYKIRIVKRGYFYPRPPRGGRPELFRCRPAGEDFYPRPPRGGRPSVSSTVSGFSCDFYPRPPRGGRLGGFFTMTERQISIHALREEGDSKNREKTPCFCLIIHLSAQIAKRCLQTKPQNHTVTCANGWYSGAKRPGKPCVLPIRTGRTSKDQHAVLGKFWVQSNVLDLGLVVVA